MRLFAAANTMLVVLISVLCQPTYASPLWEKREAFTNYEQELALGDRYALRAAQLFDISRRRARMLARYAVRAYTNASKLNASAAEPHYRAAELLYAYFVGPSTRQTKALTNQTLSHWNMFEKLAPTDPRATRLLFRRALVHTKKATKEGYQLALADYQKLLHRSDVSSDSKEATATRLGNMAEVHMMLGDLNSAILRYEQALQYDKRTSYGFGLAVALDRDGQVDRAREIMARFASANQLLIFEKETQTGNIFFVPAGEVYYYYGLAHETLGNPKRAIANYRRFITSSAHPLFQPRARDNIAALEKKLRRRNVRRR